MIHYKTEKQKPKPYGSDPQNRFELLELVALSNTMTVMKQVMRRAKQGGTDSLQTASHGFQALLQCSNILQAEATQN